MHLQGRMRHKDLLRLVGSLCGLFRIPFDASLIAQNFPSLYSLATLHEAARALGIKTGQCAIEKLDWQQLLLPAIAFQPLALPATDESNRTDSDPPLSVLLHVKASADQLLYFRSGSQIPETMPIADAARLLQRELLLVARLHGVETIREFVSGAAVTLVLDFPFLFIFLAVMFAYSWQLSLIAVGLLGTIALMSFLVAPLFRAKLDRQFMLGARNQAFLTEYIAGITTVKSLQMEPDIDHKYGDLLAQYLASGFSTKQVGNTYNVIANGLEQVMTLSILIFGALLVMRNEGFTVGMRVLQK